MVNPPDWRTALTISLRLVAGKRFFRCNLNAFAHALARYFGAAARSWLNLSAAYDLRVAEIASAQRIEREIAPATT